MSEVKEKRHRRHKRIRAKIFGTESKPRLCVFRSNKHIYAQLINDESGKILAIVSDKEVKGQEKSQQKKVDSARKVGKLLAEKALAKKLEKVVFDRSGYLYHGRIKSVADGARDGGLKF